MVLIFSFLGTALLIWYVLSLFLETSMVLIFAFLGSAAPGGGLARRAHGGHYPPCAQGIHTVFGGYYPPGAQGTHIPSCILYIGHSIHLPFPTAYASVTPYIYLFLLPIHRSLHTYTFSYVSNTPVTPYLFRRVPLSSAHRGPLE